MPLQPESNQNSNRDSGSDLNPRRGEPRSQPLPGKKRKRRKGDAKKTCRRWKKEILKGKKQRKKKRTETEKKK